MGTCRRWRYGDAKLGDVMNKPSTTITAAGLAGAIVSIFLGLLGAFFPDVLSKLPPGFEGSLVTVVSFGAGYKVREEVLRQRILDERLEDLP